MYYALINKKRYVNQKSVIYDKKSLKFDYDIIF